MKMIYDAMCYLEKIFDTFEIRNYFLIIATEKEIIWFDC